MKLVKWANEKIKKLKVLDIQLIKLSSMAFALMVARLWAPLLSLEWYWYALIFILLAVKPMYTVFKK